MKIASLSLRSDSHYSMVHAIQHWISVLQPYGASRTVNGTNVYDVRLHGIINKFTGALSVIPRRSMMFRTIGPGDEPIDLEREISDRLRVAQLPLAQSAQFQGHIDDFTQVIDSITEGGDPFGYANYVHSLRQHSTANPYYFRDIAYYTMDKFTYDKYFAIALYFWHLANAYNPGTTLKSADAAADQFGRMYGAKLVPYALQNLITAGVFSPTHLKMSRAAVDYRMDDDINKIFHYFAFG